MQNNNYDKSGHAIFISFDSKLTPNHQFSVFERIISEIGIRKKHEPEIVARGYLVKYSK